MDQKNQHFIHCNLAQKRQPSVNKIWKYVTLQIKDKTETGLRNCKETETSTE